MSEGYLKISGSTDDYVLTFDKLKLREGCKYKISGHMQTVGAPSGGFADIRADFSLAENVYESGREYVFAELSGSGRKTTFRYTSGNSARTLRALKTASAASAGSRT